jgi:ankyrin repeat protein
MSYFSGTKKLQLQVVEYYVKAGIDPHARDNFGKTALIQACCNLNLTPWIIDFLVESKFDPNATDRLGYNPLLRYLETSVERSSLPSLETVRCLIKHTKDINHLTHLEKSAALIVASHAIRDQSYEIMDEVLKSGADINQVTKIGHTFP